MIPDIASPAVIIVGWRCGGTFLTHCLSNHPDIFCARGEVLHSKTVWRKTTRGLLQTLICTLGQPHYKISMCKLTYHQAFCDEIWPYLLKRQPKVIWLYRENVIRQAMSFILMKMFYKGATKQPIHTLGKSKPARITIEPEMLLNYARRLRQNNKQGRGRMVYFKNVLELTYADVVGGERISAVTLAANRKVCRFLDVRVRQLDSGLRPTNPFPLSETLLNWSEVRRAIKNSEFTEWLKDEW